jgi:hypothetical protein
VGSFIFVAHRDARLKRNPRHGVQRSRFAALHSKASGNPLKIPNAAHSHQIKTTLGIVMGRVLPNAGGRAMRLLLALVITVAAVGSAAAQLLGQQQQERGYTIQRPGENPTFVNPTGNGGYIVQTPGETPTFINPLGNGRYIVQQPGQAPTFINPH